MKHLLWVEQLKRPPLQMLIHQLGKTRKIPLGSLSRTIGSSVQTRRQPRGPLSSTLQLKSQQSSQILKRNRLAAQDQSDLHQLTSRLISRIHPQRPRSEAKTFPTRRSKSQKMMLIRGKANTFNIKMRASRSPETSC